MRTTRSDESQDLDEHLGIISPRTLVPQIRRRHSRKRFAVPATLHRMNSFGYVSWMAFLVFWLVFGRAVVAYYMTTTVAHPDYRGTKVQVIDVRLTPEVMDTLRRGVAVRRTDGALALEPDRETIHHLIADRHGRWFVGQQEWSQFDTAELCSEHPTTNRLPLVVVSMPETATYADAVNVADQLLATAAAHGCMPGIAFASPTPDV